MIFNVLLL
jgi:hypothetical protein